MVLVDTLVSSVRDERESSVAETPTRSAGEATRILHLTRPRWAFTRDVPVLVGDPQGPPGPPGAAGSAASHRFRGPSHRAPAYRGTRRRGPCSEQRRYSPAFPSSHPTAGGGGHGGRHRGVRILIVFMLSPSGRSSSSATPARCGAAGFSQLGLARACLGLVGAARSSRSDSVTAATGSQVATRACRSPDRSRHWPRPRPNTKVQ
jgi:hypothetical protein